MSLQTKERLKTYGICCLIMLYFLASELFYIFLYEVYDVLNVAELLWILLLLIVKVLLLVIAIIIGRACFRRAEYAVDKDSEIVYRIAGWYTIINGIMLFCRFIEMF